MEDVCVKEEPLDLDEYNEALLLSESSSSIQISSVPQPKNGASSNSGIWNIEQIQFSKEIAEKYPSDFRPIIQDVFSNINLETLVNDVFYVDSHNSENGSNQHLTSSQSNLNPVSVDFNPLNLSRWESIVQKESSSNLENSQFIMPIAHSPVEGHSDKNNSKIHKIKVKFVDSSEVKVHATERIFICFHCNKEFNSSLDFDCHLQYHSNDPKTAWTARRNCDENSISLENPTGVNPILHQCHLCDRIFPRACNLSTHIRTHHTTNLEDELGYDCLEESEPEIKAKYRKRLPRHRCYYCAKIFTRLKDRTVHEKTHLRNDSKPYECKYCHSWFTKLSSLANHIRSHLPKYSMKSYTKKHQIKPYEADKSFQNDSSPKGFSENPENLYQCTKCHQSFPTVYAISSHVCTSSEDSNERFESDIGSPNSSTEDSKLILNTSKPKNDLLVEEFPYKCKFCERKFRNRSNLMNHFRSHSASVSASELQVETLNSIELKNKLVALTQKVKSLPPFKCEYCRRIFHKRCAYTVHIGSHVGKKFIKKCTYVKNNLVLYECKTCAKSFMSKIIFLEHLFSHPNELKSENSSQDNLPNQPCSEGDVKAEIESSSSPKRVKTTNASVKEVALTFSEGEKTPFSDCKITLRHNKSETSSSFQSISKSVEIPTDSKLSKVKMGGNNLSSTTQHQCIHCKKSFKSPSFVVNHICNHEDYKLLNISNVGKPQVKKDLQPEISLGKIIIKNNRHLKKTLEENVEYQCHKCKEYFLNDSLANHTCKQNNSIIIDRCTEVQANSDNDDDGLLFNNSDYNPLGTSPPSSSLVIKKAPTKAELSKDLPSVANLELPVNKEFDQSQHNSEETLQIEGCKVQSESKPNILKRGDECKLCLLGICNISDHMSKDQRESVKISQQVKGQMKEPSLHCIHCGKKFFMVFQLLNHLHVHESGTLLKQTDKDFPAGSSLSTDMPHKKGEIPTKNILATKCKQCKKKHLNFKDSLSHFCSRRPPKIKKNKASSNKQLKCYHPSNKAESVHTCRICDKTFHHKGNFIPHMIRHAQQNKMHNSTPESPMLHPSKLKSNSDTRLIKKCRKMNMHTCHICSRIFRKRCNLMNHMRSHQKKERAGIVLPTQLKEINEEETQKNNPIDIEENIPETKMKILPEFPGIKKKVLYQCQYCEKHLTTRQSFNSHIKRHKIQIRMSHMRFGKQKQRLLHTQLKRKIDQEFTEEKEPLTTKDQTSLNGIYIPPNLQETNEKVFHQCRFCEKAFYRICHLSRHVRKHHHMYVHGVTNKTQSEQPLQIKQETGYELTEEEEPSTTEDETPNDRMDIPLNLPERNEKVCHQCQFCEKVFYRVCHLSRHVRKHHNTNLMNPMYAHGVTNKTQSEQPLQMKQETGYEEKEPSTTEDETPNDRMDILSNLPERNEKVRHQCQFCEKAFYRVCHLSRHVRKHHNTNLMNHMYARGVTNKTQIEQPLQIKQETGYELTEEEEPSTTEDETPNDRIDIPSNLPERNEKLCHQCQFCEKAFYRVCHLSRHVRKHHNTNLMNHMYAHGVTNKTQSEQPLQIKQETGYEEKEPSTTEDETPNDRMDILSNLPERNEKVRHQCQFCEKAFYRVCHLSRHVRKHHNTNLMNPMYAHGVRNKIPGELTLHLKQEIGHELSQERESSINEKEIPENKMDILPNPAENENVLHQCQFCEKSYLRICHLSRHVREHHNSNMVAPHVSENVKQFEKTTFSPNESSSAKSFKCEHCGKNSTSASNLNLSSQSKKSIPLRLYECAFCSRKFHDKAKLRKHTLTHDSEFPIIYRCPRCVKSFNYKQNLIRHLAKHAEIKAAKAVDKRHFSKNSVGEPFHKKVKSFISQEKYIKKQTIKIGKWKYTCLQCGRKFGVSSTLINHIITVHSNEKTLQPDIKKISEQPPVVHSHTNQGKDTNMNNKNSHSKKTNNENEPKLKINLNKKRVKKRKKIGINSKSKLKIKNVVSYSKHKLKNKNKSEEHLKKKQKFQIQHTSSGTYTENGNISAVLEDNSHLGIQNENDDVNDTHLEAQVQETVTDGIPDLNSKRKLEMNAEIRTNYLNNDQNQDSCVFNVHSKEKLTNIESEQKYKVEMEGTTSEIFTNKINNELNFTSTNNTMEVDNHLPDLEVNEVKSNSQLTPNKNKKKPQLTCRVCSAKLTSDKEYIGHHKMFHPMRRTFVCSICEKGFPTKNELKRHQRSHTGEKPFKCIHCDFMCSRRDNLMNHRVVMHGFP